MQCVLQAMLCCVVVRDVQQMHLFTSLLRCCHIIRHIQRLILLIFPELNPIFSWQMLNLPINVFEELNSRTYSEGIRFIYVVFIGETDDFVDNVNN